jgi:hypothetical protein
MDVERYPHQGREHLFLKVPTLMRNIAPNAKYLNHLMITIKTKKVKQLDIAEYVNVPNLNQWIRLSERFTCANMNVLVKYAVSIFLDIRKPSILVAEDAI